MPLQNLDNEMHRRCANSPVRETQEYPSYA